MGKIAEIKKEVNNYDSLALEVEYKKSTIILAKINISHFNFLIYASILGGLCGFVSLIIQLIR